MKAVISDSKSSWIQSQRIAVVKYNAGNIRSMTCALQRMGIQPVVTDDAEELRGADKVIFPGVGEASTAMKYLRERGLDELLRSLTQPFLGVCLGLQLMCSHSEEHDTECLGIFNEPVRLFPGTMKVPHMGWNTLAHVRSELFRDFSLESYVYFVHSYYAAVGADTIAACTYNLSFSAALSRNNFFGVQFHPEKSGAAGELILRNFLEMGRLE
ncbi:MAG: imidazole glycerol phosphate synthase subunit HisH [Spirochaetales bacterium]|jgi:glutamine amidotransferase|nr:imidazole glycerol phosphate synthase subunit HisH [Spirochaetales bacterium]